MERTREAIVDLNLVLEGFIVQAEKGLNDPIASFARHGSIFLRKMVIGDRGTAPLLDEDTCRQLNLVSLDCTRLLARGAPLPRLHLK